MNRFIENLRIFFYSSSNNLQQILIRDLGEINNKIRKSLLNVNVKGQVIRMFVLNSFIPWAWERIRMIQQWRRPSRKIPQDSAQSPDTE
jgi:hypothetical protein